jgi:hypothetical protein
MGEPTETESALLGELTRVVGPGDGATTFWALAQPLAQNRLLTAVRWRQTLPTAIGEQELHRLAVARWGTAPEDPHQGD